MAAVDPSKDPWARARDCAPVDCAGGVLDGDVVVQRDDWVAEGYSLSSAFVASVVACHLLRCTAVVVAVVSCCWTAVVARGTCPLSHSFRDYYPKGIPGTASETSPPIACCCDPSDQAS